MRIRLLISVAVAMGVLTVGVASAQAGTLVIHVLSDRADAISGGDALVSVSLPSGVNPASVKMTLGSSNVTSEFALRLSGIEGTSDRSFDMTGAAPAKGSAAKGRTP